MYTKLMDQYTKKMYSDPVGFTKAAKKHNTKGSNTMEEMERYATVKQFAAEQNIFKEPSLRWMIFNKETNGFSKAFKKVGKKVLVDKPVFLELIKNGDTQKAA